MKQIFITPEIKRMAKQYSKGLFKDKGKTFVQPIVGLKNLIIDLEEVNDELANKDRYINYLKEIIKDYSKIKKLLPSEFDNYKTKYDAIIADCPLSAKIKYRKAPLPSKKADREKNKTMKKDFYKLIVDRMRYSETRPYLGEYMRKMGINTCVYCNNAKAAVSEDGQEVYYSFDHARPKSEYPFLSICFFNLYPCCNNCNGHKLDDEKKGFQLYVESLPVGDPFAFKIDQTIIDEKNPLSVEVDFNARNAADEEWAKKYNDDFRIEKLYNTEDEKRSSFQMIRSINKHRASYLTALKSSIPAITVTREYLFTDVLGVKDDDIIFTDMKKKLKLDTAKDAGLI